MSLAVDPEFASNRRFYTCQGGFRGPSGHEVRVVAWRLDAAATAATLRQDRCSAGSPPPPVGTAGAAC